MAKTFITKKGLKEKEERLAYCKGEYRNEIALRLDEARKQGDLSENSEYDDAKQAQADNEKEILELEALIKNCEIFEGKKYVLENTQTGKKVEYFLVGPSEVDPLNNMISNESPLGKVLFGAKTGSVVKYTAPNEKVFEYKVLEVI